MLTHDPSSGPIIDSPAPHGYHPEALVRELERRARSLRRSVVHTVYTVKTGHLGGSLSAADVMAALYFHQLRIDPARPDWPERDRFILSKGHAAPIYYACLAQRGFFPVEELATEAKLDSRLQGHPDRTKTPGCDMTSGMLGHGLCVGVGLALAARLKRAPWRTYVLLGDGESEAGVVWEGAMEAPKFRLDNLTAILDYNGLQIDGTIAEVMPLEPLAAKWRDFGWHVVEIDGHDMRQILEALDLPAKVHGQPTMIIARTVKGKGISFMENERSWHAGPPNAEQYERAMAELAD